jgi:hypothetical protein
LAKRKTAASLNFSELRRRRHHHRVLIPRNPRRTVGLGTQTRFRDTARKTSGFNDATGQFRIQKIEIVSSRSSIVVMKVIGQTMDRLVSAALLHSR